MKEVSKYVLVVWGLHCIRRPHETLFVYGTFLVCTVSYFSWCSGDLCIKVFDDGTAVVLKKPTMKPVMNLEQSWSKETVACYVC